MKDLMPVVLALIGLVGGGGGIWSVVNLKATRQKMLAEAGKTNVDAVTALGNLAIDVFLDPLKTRVKELEAEVGQLRQQVREARDAEAEVDRLKRKIAAKDDEIAALQATIVALRGGAPDVKGPL